MSGAYPHYKLCYTHEQLVEHFSLTPADLQLVLTCRGDANRCAMALPLTSDYVEANGIRLPTKRRAYTPGPDRRSILEMLMVSIDISHVSFT
jgi:hypothetical protein